MYVLKVTGKKMLLIIAVLKLKPLSFAVELLICLLLPCNGPNCNLETLWVLRTCDFKWPFNHKVLRRWLVSENWRRHCILHQPSINMDGISFVVNGLFQFCNYRLTMMHSSSSTQTSSTIYRRNKIFKIDHTTLYCIPVKWSQRK